MLKMICVEKFLDMLVLPARIDFIYKGKNITGDILLIEHLYIEETALICKIQNAKHTLSITTASIEHIFYDDAAGIFSLKIRNDDYWIVIKAFK
jgi:hypothetical protein